MSASLEGLIADVLKDLEGLAVELDKKVAAGKCTDFNQYKDWTGQAAGIRRAKERLHDRLRKGLDID